MDDAGLVNKPLGAWTKWALVWLTVFPFVGILVSIRFHNREFLGGMPLFTFGRLRSVHLGGVLFGPFTSALIALFYYCSAVRHAAVQSGVRMVAALIWNAFLRFGSLSLCMGYMVGVAPEPHVIYRRRDCGHSDRWHDITSPRISLLRVPVVRTRRRNLAIFNLPLGAVLLPYGTVNGVNSAAIHGLCMHNLVGLWITPARLATIYYFLTLSAKNMPIQGARWHPVWHGTEAMMVHGGLLIRSRSHSSR